MLPAVATKVKGGVMTSSPESTPSAISASRSASDPEAQAMANLRADEGGDFSLQLLHLRPHDELLALQDSIHGGPDVFLHGGVFGLQVEKGEEQLGSALIKRFGDLARDCLGFTSTPLKRMKKPSNYMRL